MMEQVRPCRSPFVYTQQSLALIAASRLGLTASILCSWFLQCILYALEIRVCHLYADSRSTVLQAATMRCSEPCLRL